MDRPAAGSAPAPGDDPRSREVQRPMDEGHPSAGERHRAEDEARRLTGMVRRLEPDDWAVLRSVRLAALADAPDAFGSTLTEEQEYPEAEWRDWIQGAAVFVAYRDGKPVGLAAGVADEDVRVRRLIAMWVEPRHRRRGVGSALVSAVTGWAREEGADRITLWVTMANDPARDLYLQHGFRASGTVKPLPSNPAIIEEQLVLTGSDLGRQDGASVG